MNWIAILIFLDLLSINISSIYSSPVAKIVNATYSTGVSFSRMNLPTSNACLCSCIAHPHCLSISVNKLSSTTYYDCQLFATYPSNSTQLSSSLTSNVTIYTTRTQESVYIDNGTHLSNPTNLFSNNINPWVPIFKLFTGNNQSFLWFNSSNLTTLITIPAISINQPDSHWFSILLSQWYKNLYIPNQVAIAFIVNRTNIFEFLIFNSSQSDITSWFSITRLISNHLWGISQYQNSSVGQTQVKSVYTDSDVVRSFNCNFKPTTGCEGDFYGFFFLHGGYQDTCIAGVRNISQVAIPTIYYCPTATYTNGNLNYFNIADGIMGFAR